MDLITSIMKLAASLLGLMSAALKLLPQAPGDVRKNEKDR